MENKISIMGLDIDMISSDTLISKTREYLNNDCLNVIFLANTALLEKTGTDEEYKEAVMGADLILPGEETLLSLHHVDTLKVALMVVNYECIEQIFQSIIEEKKTLYLVAESEKEANQYEEYFKKSYPNIVLEGSYYDDLEQNEELVVNQINGFAPDILFFAVKNPLQERWIMANKTRLNSKLCLAIGTVADKIPMGHPEAPEWVRRMKMEFLYHWTKENKGIRKLREIRIFKRKVEHYKNKKGGSKNGNTW